jgi:hypothetical protein
LYGGCRGRGQQQAHDNKTARQKHKAHRPIVYRYYALSEEMRKT